MDGSVALKICLVLDLEVSFCPGLNFLFVIIVTLFFHMFLLGCRWTVFILATAPRRCSIDGLSGLSLCLQWMVVLCSEFVAFSIFIV